MTQEEKQALFDAVEKSLDSEHHRKCFVKDNFSNYNVPYNNTDVFTQWFLDNNMGGSLMAHLNSEYGHDLTLTF